MLALMVFYTDTSPWIIAQPIVGEGEAEGVAGGSDERVPSLR